MNRNEKLRVQKLIESEYRARRDAVPDEVSDSQITERVSELSELCCINPLIRRLNKVENEAAEIRKKIDQAIKTRVKYKPNSRRSRSNCECIEDFGELLEFIARQQIAFEMSRSTVIDRLHREERKMIAAALAANTEADLASVLKRCGLL